MSSLKVQGNASGTGIFTITSPNSNNTRTLTLPDATTTLLGSSSTQACQAWVNFTGSTGAINASYNVSSITRNGTGDYTLNFTSAFADANYACVSTASADSTAQAPTFRYVAGYRTTTTCRLLVFNYGTGGAVDVVENDVAFFR